MLDGRCFTKEEKGRERRELKCLVSAAFSESWPEFKHTDEHPRCESSLASLRLIWSKVIRLLGRDQHCGRTCCAGGEHTIEQLWWFSNKRRADQLQTLWASRDFSVLYKDVSLQRRGGTRRPKKICQISSSALSVSLLQVYICFTSFRLSAASKFQFWNRAMRSVRCRQLQLAVQVDDHKLPVSLRAATGFSSSAETKFSLFFLLNWIITTFIREVRFLVCLCHY